MWMRLPPQLIAQSALFITWYVVAFILLFRLPRPARAGGVSPEWWKSIAAVALLAVAVWGAVGALQRRDMFLAYGCAVLAALCCALITWRRHGTLADVHVGVLAAWLLGFAALLIRLSAPDLAPPGIAEDEAKKCVDCIEVLHGGSVFKIGSLSHPNFPCLVIGPLLAVFGPSTLVAHAYSMVAGALSVVAFFILASLLLSPPIAVAATALLAASPNHLLYSRVMFGTEITLPQILFLAFSIDAARRLSWVSAIMAGSALGILLHHYVVVRALPIALVAIFVIAQIAERRRWWQRGAIFLLVLLTTAITLAPLLQRFDGRIFLLKPVQYSLFAFSDLHGPADFGQRLSAIVRQHLLLFHTMPGGSGIYAAMAHSRAAMLPLVLEVLLVFGVADAAVRWTRFSQVVMAVLFIVGLLPSILSGLPNNHRSMLVIPAVYLLIGNALERLATLWPADRRLRIAGAIAAAVLVIVGSAQSLQFYFGDAWTDANDLGGFGGNQAEIADEVLRLTQRTRAQITGESEEVSFLAWDQLRNGRLRRFSYAQWLPENWSAEQTNLIMEAHWADLRWQLHDLLPPSSVRTFNDGLGRVVGASLALGPYDLSIPRSTTAQRECGMIMFTQPRQVSVQAGALQLDGIDVDGLPSTAEPWFAAGLHDACMSQSVVATLTNPAGTQEQIRLAPVQLYEVPIYGWVHRIECQESPGRVTYLGVEPFFYHFADGVPVSMLCPHGTQHTWSAMLAARPTATTFQVWPHTEGLEMRLDGQPITITHRFDWGTFVVPASAVPQRLDIGLRTNWHGNEGIELILYVMMAGQSHIPRFDWFTPPAQETWLPVTSVAWGPSLDGVAANGK